MIAVTDAWKEMQQRFLLPESFVEISCTITEVGVQEDAVASGTYEAIFSDVGSVPGTSGEKTEKKYATLEPNLWSLDGTRSILPTEGPYTNSGYVSNIAETGSVTLTLPEVHSVAIPGVTITWSGEYDEYPHVFTVTAKNGDTVVAETTVIDNASSQSVVDLEIANYDSVTITVHNWCLPNRRARIDTVKLGQDITFTKRDILSYDHEQHGSIVSGELPKNSIEFSLDNTDNRWNPSNPTGMERYLSERQRLTVRYGLDINGTTEWIKAGTFYLSEWRAPSNGLEASFVARDIFEYLINETYTGRATGSLAAIITDALSTAGVPDDFEYELAESLGDYDATIDLAQGYSCAEVIQMCANMGACLMYQDRNGKLHITEFTKPGADYVPSYLIPMALSYIYPQIELSKPLKSVSVAYGDNVHVLEVNSSGETQTVNNPLVNEKAAAEAVANNVAYMLKSRKSVSGEYRSDPRLDLFDVVSVDTKFGVESPVVITNIKYSFTGAFRGSYTGRVMA